MPDEADLLALVRKDGALLETALVTLARVMKLPALQPARSGNALRIDTRLLALQLEAAYRVSEFYALKEHPEVWERVIAVRRREAEHDDAGSSDSAGDGSKRAG